MNEIAKKIAHIFFFISLVNIQQINAQSITQDPNRNPFYNYTVVGFFTPAPPVIDAVLDDYCWTRATATGSSFGGGAGFDGNNFPDNQSIRMPINMSDNGTVSPSIPPDNEYTGAYPTTAGTFGITWDKSYLYFAVKISNQAAADLTSSTNERGVILYINNGNGRSGVSDPINEIFPRHYVANRDMLFQLRYLPEPGHVDFPTFNITNGLAFFGTEIVPNTYKFAVSKTNDGYIYEGRISWEIINAEFIDKTNGSYSNDKWRPQRGRLLGFDVGASLFRGTGPQIEMNWNQCCYDANWERSSNFGYLQLAGDTLASSCPTSFNVTITSASITGSNQKVKVSAIDFLPIDAGREINWTLEGKSGNYPLALINNNTEIITPLNNGILTITGKSKVDRCLNSTIAGIVTLPISNQLSPTSISITGTDITTNWGTSTLAAIVAPSNAPNDVVWSIEPASNLATINSITGVLKATALGSGPITVKATSLANGVFENKLINITTPAVINQCWTINSYTYVNQCDRTINSMTIAGFNIGTKVQLLAQYVSETSGPIPNIPDELMEYTIQQNVPAASIAKVPSWELTLNQPTGFFYITGMYLNDTTKVHVFKVTLMGATTITGCNSTTSGVNYFSLSNLAFYNNCITSINNDLIEGSTFIVFPNPATDEVNIDVTLKSFSLLAIEVVNIIGEVVLSNVTPQPSGRSIVKLSTASLLPGLYIIKAKTSGEGTIAKKIIVNR